MLQKIGAMRDYNEDTKSKSEHFCSAGILRQFWFRPMHFPPLILHGRTSRVLQAFQPDQARTEWMRTAGLQIDQDILHIVQKIWSKSDER